MIEDPVDRVRAALTLAGHPDTITAHPAGTQTAADAAAAIGCDVAQIAESIVFRTSTADLIRLTGAVVAPVSELPGWSVIGSGR